MFSGGDAAKPVKVTLSAWAASQSRGWEAGLRGMRKGGVRYVAVSAAAVATEIQGRGELTPAARAYRLEVLKMKRSGSTSKGASSSAPDATVASTVTTEEQRRPTPHDLPLPPRLRPRRPRHHPPARRPRRSPPKAP